MIKVKSHKRERVIVSCPFCGGEYLLPRYNDANPVSVDWYTCLLCCRLVKIKDAEHKMADE